MHTFDLQAIFPVIYFHVLLSTAGTVGPYQYQISVEGGSENDGKQAAPLHCGQFSLKIRPQPMVEKRPHQTSGRNLTTTRPGCAQPSITRPETVKRNCNSRCHKTDLHLNLGD